MADQKPRTAALVVHPILDHESARSPDSSLAEAVGLALAINLDIREQALVRVNRPSPATLLGGGQVTRFKELVEKQSIMLTIVDHALSPSQQRNLEKALNCKVIDRTGLILEIFGERARTREGQSQVELAALTYQRSRLVRSWTHLERQRSSGGAGGFMSGPGESQLEIDRRLIDARIDRIKLDLDEVRRTRGLQRRARDRRQQKLVALVGYTNAGKSTLFNRLTQADVLAKDMLFATLDPTLRRLELGPQREAMLADTVGFIADLPTGLVEAFRATLEEVTAADLILHVRDAAHEDSGAQRDDVMAVLGSLGIEESDPRLVEVLNKVDLLPPEQRALLRQEALFRGGDQPPLLPISAHDGTGLTELQTLLADKLFSPEIERQIAVQHGDGAARAWLYQHGRVSYCDDEAEAEVLTVALSDTAYQAYQQRFGVRT